MINEYIFKIGDYITLDKKLKHFGWYTDKVLKIVDIDANGILIVDRLLSHYNGLTNKLHPTKAVLNIKATRAEKLKTILND